MINVVIMSGPSGSGKSTQAKGFATVMESEEEDGVIISADYHFCSDLQGEMSIHFSDLSSLDDQTYEFKEGEIALAHQRCMREFAKWLQKVEGREENFTIIVDNTNIEAFEINPYYLLGEAFGAKVEILRVVAPLKQCLERNIHGVPGDIVRLMHEKFSEVDPQGKPKQHMPWWVFRNL